MSILIKGMEMPKNCGECSFLQESVWRGKMFPCVCVAGGFVVKPSETDLKDGLCPLVELPEKHGRLIDADELIEDLKHDVAIDQDSLDYEELTEINRRLIQDDKDVKQNAIDLLEHTSCIIEAEDEG